MFYFQFQGFLSLSQHWLAIQSCNIAWLFVIFPDSSLGKEFACNVGDPSSIPRAGRSAGEGIGYPLQYSWASLCGLAGKESTCNVGELGSIPGLGRSPGEGKGSPFQYSGLENSMDCVAHGVTKSQTRLSDFHFLFHFPNLITPHIFKNFKILVR